MNTVYLDDEDFLRYEDAWRYFDQANDWAQAQCASYVGYRIQDVSDNSLIYDQIAAYDFRDPKDSLMFSIRWKS